MCGSRLEAGLLRASILLAATLWLTGCNRSRMACEATERVRVIIDGQEFAIPAGLKPHFFTRSGLVDRLPSYINRDTRGRWAYCQTQSEPPAQAEKMAFYPKDAKTAEVSFIVVGDIARFQQQQAGDWPTYKDAGFIVTATKGVTYVFAQPGAVRPSPVTANCLPEEVEGFRPCNVSFVSQSNVVVRFQMLNRHRLADWPGIIAKVDAYVSSLEARV